MPSRADDQAPVGKSGPLIRSMSASSSSSSVGLGVVQRPDDAGGDLAQVVRRDVGGHADRDPRAAVDQQVRDPGRQHRRLRWSAVVVRARSRRCPRRCRAASPCASGVQPALGVPHGGRRVVARRAEVALAVDQRVAQRPRLGHPDQRCRRSASRRAGGSYPSRRRRPGRTSRSRGRGGSRSRTSRRAPGGAPA